MNIQDEAPAFTFDDVCLIPQYSEVKSRSDVDLKQKGLLGDFDIPIISANMDTVTESAMAIAMTKAGGRGIFHRYMGDRTRNELRDFRNVFGWDSNYLIVSVGVGISAQHEFEQLHPCAMNICIDVAHGHCEQAIDMIRWLREYGYDGAVIIAGNVATPEGVKDLATAGADIIKVGIGPGSLCSTRVVTGHGVPQLTAIMQCAEAADTISGELDRPIEIIADGGIRNSGDIAKALAAGANYVMLGSLLAGTDEAPGQLIERDGRRYKQYRGMASKEVQEQLGKKAAPEGVAQLKEYKGPVANVLHDLEWGLRSALTYSGASNLEEFRHKARFMRVTPSSFIEGTPHGLQK